MTFRPSQFAPSAVDETRTRQPECRLCGRPIVFVEMWDTGKLMPCDPGMKPGDGRRHLVVRWPRGRKTVGRVVARAAEDVTGLEPHFGTCPCRPRKVAVEAAAEPDLFSQPDDR